MRRRLAIALVIVTLAGIGADLWVRKTYGMFLPWEIPKRIDVCGRRYHPSSTRVEPGPRIVIQRIEATFLSLPILLPDLAPTDSGLPYAGCPRQLDLVVGDQVIAYGPPEGGP